MKQSKETLQKQIVQLLGERGVTAKALPAPSKHRITQRTGLVVKG